jgi:hypothetical protein
VTFSEICSLSIGNKGDELVIKKNKKAFTAARRRRLTVTTILMVRVLIFSSFLSSEYRGELE